MTILARSLCAYRFLEVINRVCLIQSVSCLSDQATASCNAANTSTNSFRSCNFEVFGTVQGVYFRQHTQEQATKFNLVGWVQNTERKTVEGYMEGEKPNIDQMKDWLQNNGSPQSKISKAQFTNEQSISKLTGNKFDIRR